MTQTDKEFYASRPKPFRDDLEKRIILPQQEIDDMEWTWGMGDIDRAFQNLELERRRLNAALAAKDKDLAGSPTSVAQDYCPTTKEEFTSLMNAARQGGYSTGVEFYRERIAAKDKELERVKGALALGEAYVALSKTPRTDKLTGTFYLRCDDCPQPNKCEQLKSMHPDDARRIEQDLSAASAELERMKGALTILYDKWNNGIACYENPSTAAGYVGRAINLSLKEDNELFSLLHPAEEQKEGKL